MSRRRTRRFARLLILMGAVALAVDEAASQSQDPAPAVSGVSLFSAPASGDTYQRGDTIQVRVDFDRLVAVTGAPVVDVTIGSRTRAAALSFTAGLPSRTSSLFFAYTVVEEDRDTDGISIAANATRLNGGSIKAAADGTTDADLTHSALAADSDHKVDGSVNTAPSVSSVSFVGSPADGDTYQLGETIEVKVVFDRFVTDSTLTQVALTIGGQTALAAWYEGAGYGGGITDYYYRYEVQSNDFDADGISIASNAIRLNGDTIKSAADGTTDADLTHAAVPDDASRKVDGVQISGPAVTYVSFHSIPNSGDAFQSGERITLQVGFDRAVKVSGSPSVELTVGSGIRHATRFGGISLDGKLLGFGYVVQARDHDFDGVSIAANAIRLNGGTITATDGTTAAVLTHAAVPADPTRKVGDATAPPPTVSPAVSSVVFRSSPASGDTYQRGETIDVRVLFTEPIAVTGSPSLALDIGGQTRAAAFWGTHHARSASFRYTVAATDRDADGISIAANAIRLDGGSITAWDGSAEAVLDHGAVAADSAHKVNGKLITVPAVSGVSIASRPRGGGTYGRGESIVVEVRFSEPVSVTGAPRLALTVGSATRSADFSRAAGSSLWFGYEVQEDDRDGDGIGISAGALTLNGGTVKDSDENDAVLGLGRHAIANAGGHRVDGSRVDTVAPEVTGVTLTSSPQDGRSFVLGETIEIEVQFDEPVTVTGSPRLTLAVGSRERTAVYASSRQRIIRFRHVVEDGDVGALAVPPDALSLNGGTILDAGGNAAVLRLADEPIALGYAANGVRRDDDPPTVLSVVFESRPPGGDTYHRGEIVEAAVRFSEPVAVTGNPQLALAVGTETRRAGFFSAGGQYVRFRYTVQEQDQAPDGVGVADEGLSLNGGAILDAAGNPADLSLAAASKGTGHAVDGGAARETVPTRAAVTSQPGDGEVYGRGESVDVEVRFSKEVTVTGQPQLELTIGAPPAPSSARAGRLATAAAGTRPVTRVATFVSGANERLHFRYVVQAGDDSGGGHISFADDALRLNGATITDAAGQALGRNNLTLADAQVVPGDMVDGALSEPAAPSRAEVVSAPQADRTYRLGEHILVDVQFDKGVTVTGSPRLELTIDHAAGSARHASFVSADHDTIRFRYDVQADDRDEDGIAIPTDALRLNGGSIGGSGGDAAELGLDRAEIIVPADKVDGRTAESAAPVVESVTVVSAPPDGSYGTGDPVTVEVRFSEAVTVTGRPHLELSIGATTREAGVSMRSAPAVVTFAYTLRAGDATRERISVPANAIRLNGGSIRDGAGNDAVLDSSEVVVSVRQAVDPGVGIGCKQPVVSAPRALQTASAGSGGEIDNYDFELTLDLEENRDGSVRAVELGCVALAAPDRQFSYSITAGDDSRFVVGAADGALRYVGTGENAERTPEYRLTVTATANDDGDALRLAVRVRIVEAADRLAVVLSTMQPYVGEEITASLAGRDGVPAAGATWQWWRRRGSDGDWTAVGNATTASYTPVAADAGHSLQARVSYRADDGSHTAASAQTEPVDLPPARRARMLQVGLTGFARTVAAAAVQVIGDRFTLMERPGVGHDAMDLAVTLNGRPLGLSDAADADARAEMVRNVAEALGIRAQDEDVSWAAPSGAQFLADSAFSSGGAADRGGSRWGVWGSGDLSHFSGDVDGFSQDGAVLSGYLGVDYRFVPNALAGLAASYSALDITSASGVEGDATLEGALVNVFPYGLWRPEEWLGIWSLAGFGMGEAELTDVAGTIRGDVRTWLGAAGQRTEFWSGGGVSLAAKSDGFVTGVTTTGGLPEVSAHAWRARMLVEAGLQWLPEGARVSGLVELGARLDGGDAERGLGAEAGATLRYTHTGTGLGLTGRGRVLLVHEDRDVREWGASAALTWAPPEHRAGPAVSVAPSWGRPASGTDALWRDPPAVLTTHGATHAGHRSSWLPDMVDVTVAYDLGGLDAEVFGRRLTGSGDAVYQFGFGGSLEY